MKIIFKHLSGPEIELDGITYETTLRDVKRFYERAASTKRSWYSFIINGKRGLVNDNSRNKFSDYLKTVHNVDFDPNATLTIRVVFNLGNNTDLFRHETVISSDVTNSNESSRLICGISLDIIKGMPVKINGRYYDSEAFCDYILAEQPRYRRAAESDQPYVPLCPMRQPLPEILQRIVTNPITRDNPSVARGDVLGILASIYDDSIEQYEDDCSAVLASSKR